MSFNVGENIGPYRIIEQLGQGGMATVFKAYHASLDRYVALKVLHPAFNQDPNFEARFQREARVVAKLEHPNIVPVYDYAEQEKRPYLVMKFIEGDTLKARMDKSPLSSEEIMKIVNAVGSGLAYAHKQGVLHRDIKPSNVLLTTDGQIYLADFGLARIAQAGESTLSSDVMLGTPQYISPEQAMGKSDLDQRTDLYSFGVMLYEMAVGKVPFSADTPFSIIHDHIYSPLPLPRKVNQNVPEAVERVLLKALAKEREDRFEDSAKLVAAFQEAWNEADVPMQGSSINASHAVRADVETVGARAELEPTKVASVSMKVAEGKEKDDETEATQASKKKRSPWMWISAGLALILCLGFLAFARNNRLFARLGAQPPQQNAPIPPADQDQPLPPPPPEQGLPPDGANVADAETLAKEYPEDIDIQLDLGLAYWDAGMPRQAQDKVNELVKQAGPDNKEFYIRAGNQFAAREAWPPAGLMYLQAVRSYQKDGDVPEGIINQFHEAVYKGAERPEANGLLQLPAIEEIDPSISFIAKARNELYNGRVEDGMIFLNQVRRLDPEMAEVLMLQAEFDRHDGNYAQARNAAKELSSNSSIPEWIRIFADEFLKRTL
jgi:serine/threonine protein kinase